MNGDGARVLEQLRALPGAAGLLDRLAADDRVWVVGGAVRDVLLGREPLEMDFVVEGDAVAVARGLGGPVLVHEPFATATVAGVDIASARTESYPVPGALPVVSVGASIEEDLARRDFSVNAIAVRVADGDLREWPGALEDLSAGSLRVLHRRSFVDDPTRLLRLARYAARLGFDIEDGTLALASGVDPWTAGGSRLGAELRRLAAEPQPAGMEWLERLGLGPVLLGEGFSTDLVGPSIALLDAPAAALAATGAPTRERLDELAFPAAERDLIASAIERAGEVEARLAAEDWVALRRVSPVAVAVAGARGPARAARRWLDELRHVRLAITGDDLLAAGLSGPAVGAGLERAWAVAYAGGGREEQLRASTGA